jgi:3(or 17)beta-hydroxysteroid dehydrogenase
MGRLEGKVALVTGGASGLGKAVGQRLKAEGATLVITDLQRELGEATARECGFRFLQHDVTSEADWSRVIADVEGREGRLHVLVNNAGILGPTEAVSPENTPLEAWKKVFGVNTDGVFLGCRAGIAAMRRTGSGSIINISSIAGLRATPYATAYGASKAAVRQLTKSVAQYCAEQKLNIRCNSVHPGDVRTPLWERGAEDAARRLGLPLETIIAEERADCPMGDFTSPEDISAAVAYLASDDARHVNGIKLIVDGGTTNCDSYRPRSQRTAAAARKS